MLRQNSESFLSAFKSSELNCPDQEEKHSEIPKPNITLGPPASLLPPNSQYFPFNLYHSLFNGSSGSFNPMLALAAQQNPLLASAYANIVSSNGDGISLTHLSKYS